jgi:hypothetical protein
VILFEMVTGQLPFDAPDIPSFFIAHIQQMPPRPSEVAPSCPRRLEELILALMEKDPAKRPVDAHQVIKELSAIAPTTGEDSAIAPQPSSAGRQVAPTLPPTTLAAWGDRTSLFEKMLARAYPDGSIPEHYVRSLGEIRGFLTRIQELRSDALRDQRVLEAMETEAREDRARLGNAVQTLAEDLSNARAAARSSHDEVAPYLSAEDAAKKSYESAFGKVESLGGHRLADAPRPEVVAALRDEVDALDRWALAHGAGKKARGWVASKSGEVEDLEFQIRALRGQLEQREAAYDQKRAETESALRRRGQEVEQLEQRLIQIAGAFVAPLRENPGLADLFVQLERAG